ncbi:SulP family inorganic anion transporter [Xanthovirga aplysinae]|uniref:SulP family inorganic anion transporter n=1 Tax=Xanthovirga aplysinae TaxID=2529853 RepID=UPI0012BC0022|nr:SulP family inorganic anion transporter [Xanthovirga aplysinae]MTI32162.1 SulP family inorganic anion transporter [Xanthovirga aplysinae]
MGSQKKTFFENIKHDFPASIVVFLVAMPLCLGIALASGAPLFSGIIAGIVGGIIVGLLSGSALGVSGPAAGLAVIVLSSIQELGAFDIFLFAVVLAGAMQLIMGLLKAGVIAYYFPSSVIKGMLSGIGVIIILKQIPHAFGYDKSSGEGFSFVQVDGQSTFSELINMLNFINPAALIIALISIAILILWEQPFIKRMAASKLIQGPLVVVILGIGLNMFFQNLGMWTLKENQVVNIPVAESLGGFFGQFTFPDFSQWANPQIYVIAITIAVVASLETLLCVEATDKLDPQKRVTPTNRELIAQGVGNMVSGFIGGLPITQVIVRSSANIQSGGKTKASAFFHGVLLLVCALSIPKILNLIPLASLAAILLVVGYKLAKPALVKEMYRLGRSQFVPFMVTVLGIVFTNLLLGIFLGLVIAIFHILWNNFKTPYHFDSDLYVKGKPVEITLAEDVSFLNKASILRTLNQLPDDTYVIIDASKTKSIHPDVLEIIEDFKENAKTRDITIEILGLKLSKKQDPVKQFGRVVLEQPMAKRNAKVRLFN